MKEISKKDSDMASRVFLGRVGILPGVSVDSEVYAGRADLPLNGATEYINIEKAWHSFEDIPTENDMCLLNFGSEVYGIGQCFTDGYGKYNWKTDLGEYPMAVAYRWAYIKDLLPSKQ